MNVALANPYRFGVVESWLSFFNGLEGDLHADRSDLERLGLHAFIYGGEAGSHRQPRRGRAVRGGAAGRRAPMPTAPSTRANTTSKRSKRTSSAAAVPRAGPASSAAACRLTDVRAGERRGASAGSGVDGRSRGRSARRGSCGDRRAGDRTSGVRRAAIGSLEIGELRVDRLTVGELVVERGPAAQSPRP